jgi:TonB family protein
VSASGDVTEVAIVKPIGLGLDQVALKAVRAWKFHPGLVNDKPIPARLVLETSFHST